MEAKVPKFFGFSSKGESPSLGDEGGEVDWSSPSKVNQMQKFTPKDPGERTMNEETVVGFRIGRTKKTQMRVKNKMGVLTLETILGECTTPSDFPEEALDLRGNQSKPNGRRMERGGVGGR